LHNEADRRGLEDEMDLGKLRGGELIAAIGGIVLLVSLLFLDWYGIGASFETPLGEVGVGAEFGAWDNQGFFGALANLVILAAGVAAVGLALLTATSRTVALPVAASALTAALGLCAVLMVGLRMLLQPFDGSIVDLEFGIFVALIGAAAVAYGGWQSMQEEGASFEQARDQLQARFGERASERDVPSRPPAEPGTGPGPGGTFPDAGERPGGGPPPGSPGEEDVGD
jgi:hypothetical protein